MGGKGSAPAAPDYTPIAQSSLESAKVQQETAREQLQWAKDQYADQAPTTKKFVDQMVDDSKQQSAHAQTMFDQYQTTFQPLMKKFADTASGWNAPARAEQQAGMAMADVSTQMNKQREASLQQLESFGVDPSQTRYSALDLGTRVQQAAATAATGTQSRQLTEQQGLALMGQAINIGSGIPSQVTQTFAGAAGSGGTGMNAANAGMQTGSNIMGSPTSWSSAANTSLNTSASALNMGYNNQMAGAQFDRQGSQDTMKGIGSLIGAAAMVAAV